MRVLIIGLGSIGRRHAENLAALDAQTEFVFLRRATKPDQLVDRLGGRIVTSLANGLAARPDLVVLATPSALHIDHLPELIVSGVPLLVEKPVVTNLTDCMRCLTALQKAPSAPRAVAFNFRHVPSLGRMRQEITSGRIGQVLRASFTAGQWLPDWRPSQDYRAGYSASHDLGGGVELDLVHEIDLARWFLGELDLKAAVGGHLSRLEIRSHDVATMILGPAHGAPLVTVTLDYVSRQRVRRYEVVGDEGTLIWDISGRLDLLGPTGHCTRLEDAAGGFDIAASYVAMMRRMLEAGAGAWPEPLQRLEDGLVSSRLAIEAREEGMHQ